MALAYSSGLGIVKGENNKYTILISLPLKRFHEGDQVYKGFVLQPRRSVPSVRGDYSTAETGD